ncbi:MAG: hemerythrin domain-containing protein [Elusimicrobia bacterium]|nr:hemerythrin domain-containing protein [Elusimicrobiota bacterium]
MSVLDVLIEEHLLLYRLVGYLQKGAVESRAPERLRGDLLAFFCALNRHEEFEEILFGGPGGVTGPEPDGLLGQHRRLAEIRAEIQAELKDPERMSAPGLGSRVVALAERLREHFAWEERVLWPLRTPSGPLAEVDLENRARAELLLLTAEAAQQGIRLSASVGPS